MFPLSELRTKIHSIPRNPSIIKFFRYAKLGEKVGKITKAQVKKIAEIKLPDLNTDSIESAMRTVEGTCRSMGVDVVD